LEASLFLSFATAKPRSAYYYYFLQHSYISYLLTFSKNQDIVSDNNYNYISGNKEVFMKNNTIIVSALTIIMCSSVALGMQQQPQAPQGQSWLKTVTENKTTAVGACLGFVGTVATIYLWSQSGSKKPKKAALACAVSDAELLKAGLTTEEAAELLPWQKECADLLSQVFGDKKIGDIQKEVVQKEFGPYSYLAEKDFMTKLTKAQLEKLQAILKMYNVTFLEQTRVEIGLNLDADRQKDAVAALKDMKDFKGLFEDRYVLTVEQKTYVSSFIKILDTYTEQCALIEEAIASEDPQAFIAQQY